jgi:NAD+ synthase (glutamine-hydrolysing)
MKIAVTQIANEVGSAEAMAQGIAQVLSSASADLVVFPELTLAGYPPEDLLLRPGFYRQCHSARQWLLAQPFSSAYVFGHPYLSDDALYNALTLRHDGQTHIYCKRELPNYTVFDEKRYFQAGDDTLVATIAGVGVGFLICEDAWLETGALRARDAGAKLLVVINASPWHQGKLNERLHAMRERVRDVGLPLVYVHWVGGQDDLVFDGQSFALNADGSLAALAPAFTAGSFELEFDAISGRFTTPPWHVAEHPSELGLLYQALVTSTRDYVNKNRFPGVLLGLSGGIDSALTLAIAVDAFGPERVHAYMLPTRYTSELSLKEAKQQAESLGVHYEVLAIGEITQAFEQTLAASFVGRNPDITEENLQARTRGVLLMALSNKFGWMLLSTGNKSEMAVGYATIYGDMCGGYAPLKDVYKTEVFALARYLNESRPMIPEAVIMRPPSAELRDNQTDQDSLPDYGLLDAILMRFIERECSRDEIIAEGFDAATVERVVGMVLRNEYKRRQSAPGPRVTSKAFGRDRRYPISSGYR